MHNLSIFSRPLIHRIAQSLDGAPPAHLVLSGGPLLGKSTLLAHLRGRVDAQAAVWINCAEARREDGPPTVPAGRDGRDETGGRVVFVDNFEQIGGWSAEAQRCWSNWLGQSDARCSVILASSRPLHELREVAGLSTRIPRFQQHFLGLIDGEESARIIGASLEEAGGEALLTAPLTELCGGHPFLLDRVDELLADVAGLLPGGGPVAPEHLPLLRLRLAATHGQILFDSQWQTLEGAEEQPGWGVRDLLAELVGRPLPFDALSPAQMGPMNWLLVQGMVRIDGHSYRLFSPLLREYLTLRLGVTPEAGDSNRAALDSTHALVEREAHRFTPQEKTLLLYFLERPGVIVSVDELLAEVWQRPDGSVRRVQEGIRRLRHRLAELDGPVGAIENEWGQGYRYVPANGFG